MKRYNNCKDMYRKWILQLLVLISVVTMCYLMNTKTVSAASLYLEKEVVVGKQITFQGETAGYRFFSNNERTAYVSSKGVVTGKRKGTVTITAKKGTKKKHYSVKVQSNGNKPSMTVCADELTIGKPKLVRHNGKKVIAFSVTNHSKKGTVKKLRLKYALTVSAQSESFADNTTGDVVVDDDGNIIPDEEENENTELIDKDVVISFVKLKPGKSRVFYYEKIKNPVEMYAAEQQKVIVYSGSAKQIYDTLSEEYGYSWGVPDTTPPVIKGFIGKNSYHQGDIYVVLYPDQKTNYKKYVRAYDARDGKVNVKADLSKIDWSRKGRYTIKVYAQDKAGNRAEKKMKVQVRTLSGIDLYADRILKSIIRKGWSDKAKCQAIYRYVGSHMSYVDYNGGQSWESAALRGLRYRNGNCYAYYSLSRLLLTRAGIPNLMITRYPAVPNHHHWWNLAYVSGGWYHFDTTPRRLRGRFCLLTDSQINIYNSRSRGTFSFASWKYPKRATKRICPGPF